MQWGSQQEINVDISNGTSSTEFDKLAVVEYINRVVEKYNASNDIETMDVYIKKFSTTHFGRNLFFCNISLNTPYGLISEHGSGWSVKNAVKYALDSALTSMHKSAEETLFGRYSNAEEYFEI